MKKRVCILFSMIFALALLLNAKLIYGAETRVDLNSSGSIYAEIDSKGVATIKGHGTYDGTCSSKLTADNTITGIIFRGDSGKIVFDANDSNFFSQSALNGNLITKFICDENSNVDTSRATMFMGYFDYQENLETIDLSGFDTRSATDMYMFSGCKSIRTLNLSSFNTANVNSFGPCFNGMEGLEELIIPNFKIKDDALSSNAFTYPNSLKIIDMRYADFSGVTDSYLFSNMPYLEKIYVPEKINEGLDITLDSIYPEHHERTFYIMDKNNNYLGITTKLISSKTAIDGKYPYYITSKKPDSQRILESISATKTKTTYEIGQSVSLNDITVIAKYDNGTQRSVTGFNATLENTNTVMISYSENGITKGDAIHIDFVEPKVTLSSIKVNKTNKTYADEQSIVTTDITIEPSMSDGTKLPVVAYNAPGVSISRDHDILTVSYTYEGVTKTSEVLLNVTGLNYLREIRATKKTTSYDEDESIDTDDITVRAYFTHETIRLDEDDYDVFVDEDNEEIEIKYVYEGKTYKCYIELDIDSDDDDNRYLKKIVAYKDKTEYYSNEKVDYDDLYIKVYYVSSSKKTETIDYTDKDSNMKVSINSAKTKITVKYTYRSETCSDTIDIKWKDGYNPNTTIITYPNKKQIKLYIGSTTTYLNGTYYQLDVMPETKNSRTYLPIRYVAEALGATVFWSNIKPNEVRITKDNRNITLTIGNQYALVNGASYMLDDAPYVKNDRTYLPVRFISEQLGATVTWNQSNPNEVIIEG